MSYAGQQADGTVVARGADGTIAGAVEVLDTQLSGALAAEGLLSAENMAQARPLLQARVVGGHLELEAVEGASLAAVVAASKASHTLRAPTGLQMIQSGIDELHAAEPGASLRGPSADPNPGGDPQHVTGSDMDLISRGVTEAGL